MSGVLTVHDVVSLSPVIPVATFDDPKRAVQAAHALVDGGVRVLEITLRTPTALDCLAAVAGEVPELVVGAGTVLDRTQVDRAAAAGARFLVSPGATASLLDAMSDSGLPFLPGAATVSEAMSLAERGLRVAKFFPASAAGGPRFLRALADPLPEMVFCPTGGISSADASDYLSCRNVACIGASWLTAPELLATGDYASITRLASAAAALAPLVSP